MDSESNQAAGSDVESESETYERPPSSYGSMKSECDEMEKKSDEEEEGGGGIPEVVCFAAPDPPAPPVVGSQMGHSRYTETLYTEATEQTRPPDGMVIDAGSEELDDLEEAELDEDDELLTTCSPEPPEPLEMEGLPQEDESSQPGKLDPELDLPYIFKSIQEVLSRLNNDELFKFKIWFKKWEPLPVLQQILDGDVLDFVDKIIELFGQDKALTKTISTLERLEKTEEINELKTKCAKALFRFYLKEFLFRKSQITHEGVPQAGKQQFLNAVYVEPQISIRGFGGVDPSHEILTQTPKPIQVPSEDSLVALNNLFRLQKEDGSPVKTVVTTGIPGVGMSVSVAKFCLDWSEEKANRDIQYILKLSFRSLRHFRNKEYEEEGISMQEILEYCHAPIKGLKILEEENAKYIIIMDCYDCYEAPLDFQKAPEITDNNTKTHIDILIVNLIRGNLLPNARLWILGRRGAVTEIPSKFVDVVAELQGFTDEMKDDYLTKHFADAQLSAKIVRHYKRVPTIQILARQPFFTWMVSRIFKSCYKQENYGSNKPRVTPFLIHFIIIQTNRMLKFYFRKRDNEKWTKVEVNLLRMLGKMSFKMLEKNTNVFTEEDVKDVALELNEVVVFSGLCTELVPTAITGKRTFCFSHYTIQEFMAALYVFLAFYLDSKNVLESGFLPRVFSYKYNGKSAAGLVQCAVARTLGSKLGHYDMFLRYLCGLLSEHCHCNLLAGFLYSHGIPKVEGLKEVEQLLEQTIQSTPEDRKRNLYECLREMTQKDD
ncbi:PREDICTED: protein NLRC3-like [Poecilia mexicana]|uniref:Pyrin domain-containing protein n=1 Tax=Poecilia mexicana TaxID=48701 RepID=A0A3B3XVG3_9TELE|nr:PREDICTED: protein NLRC3-like [Poecilia mexicana]